MKEIMEEKIGIDFLSSRNRKVLDFGDNMKITIKHINKKNIDEIIAKQELYLIENKRQIPLEEIMLELLKRTSNLNIDVNNQDKILKILKNPQNIWSNLLVSELKSIILEINQLKINNTRNDIIEINQLVENIKISKELTDETKDFFKENENILLNSEDDVFLDSLEHLGLVQINEIKDNK